MAIATEVLDPREEQIVEKEPLALEIESAAARILVVDQASAEIAANFDRRAKDAADEIEAARVEITGPLNAVLKLVNGRAKPMLDRIDKARRVVRARIAEWQDAERRKAEEAARIANEKAEAERRKQEALAAENQRKADEARAAGDAAKAAKLEAKAEVQQEKAASVPAYVPAPMPAAPAGMSAARPWKATCTDLEALLVAAVSDPDATRRAIARGMLKVEFSQQAGNRQAQATKNLVAIPGVVFAQATEVRQSGR